MIRHFDKIENLGVFARYKKPDGMVPFAKFNLIYGLNGSGKTTLSRFFLDLNTGTAAGFEKLKYKIATDEGQFTQGKPYSRKIRVFNPEYVEANIGELEGKLNPIFVIGEDNKKLVSVVEKDEKTLKKAETALVEKTSEHVKLAKKRGQIFTDIASEITKNTAGTTTRTYRKNNAEAAFEALTDHKTLSIEDLATASKSMKQPVMAKIENISFSAIDLKIEDKSGVPSLSALHDLEKYVSKIVQTSATSIAIQRLVDNPTIAQWVEKGVTIHDQTDGDTCEYCQQEIPKERAEALASHFNDSDRNLRNQLDQSLEDLEALHESFQNLAAPVKSNFYSEFQEPYSEAFKTISSFKQPLLNQLAELTKLINDKLTRRTEGYQIDLARIIHRSRDY